MTNQNSVVKAGTSRFNQVLYGLFVMLGLYHLLFNQDIDSAFTNLGISLIFDPFDQSISFTERPVYQKAWLILHVVVLFSLVAIFFVQKFL